MRSTRRTWNARAPTCWIPSGLWGSSSIPRALSTMSRVSPGRALLPRWAISPMRRIPPSRRIRTKRSPRPAAKRRVPPQPDKNRTPPSPGFSPDEGGVFVWERRGRRAIGHTWGKKRAGKMAFPPAQTHCPAGFRAAARLPRYMGNAAPKQIPPQHRPGRAAGGFSYTGTGRIRLRHRATWRRWGSRERRLPKPGHR